MYLLLAKTGKQEIINWAITFSKKKRKQEIINWAIYV